MRRIVESMARTADDVALLAYAQHMAATARSGAARDLFEKYLEIEKQRLAAAGRGPATAHPRPDVRMARRRRQPVARRGGNDEGCSG